METYLAILRGINVSGQKMIKMNELTDLFDQLGFAQVRSYIQSGNVRFDCAPADTPALAGRIAQAIQQQFGFEVPVLVLTAREWQIVAENNPFLREEGIDPAFLHVTLLAETPADAQVEKIDGDHFAPDRFRVCGRAVYLYCPNGYGNTKINNSFFENKLKVTATTRNWKTMQELLRLAQSS